MRHSRNEYESSLHWLDHKRCVRETLAYAGTSMLEFANRNGLSADAVDLGRVSLRTVQEDTGVSYAKMEELGRN
jgi:hypothetical protein